MYSRDPVPADLQSAGAEPGDLQSPLCIARSFKNKLLPQAKIIVFANAQTISHCKC